jgi:hypothetical protein
MAKPQRLLPKPIEPPTPLTPGQTREGTPPVRVASDFREHARLTAERDERNRDLGVRLGDLAIAGQQPAPVRGE